MVVLRTFRHPGIQATIERYRGITGYVLVCRAVSDRPDYLLERVDLDVSQVR